MTKAEQDALKATNLALAFALKDAIAELKYALEYKNEHLVEKHKDRETVEELEAVLGLYLNESQIIFREIQADAIDSLHFPAFLRKMWSGEEVQEWLKQQADNKR